MCGRFSCSLAADELSCASSYKDPISGLFIKIPCIFTEKFDASCNIPPTTKAPIIINTTTSEYKPVIVLARFGVIPHWFNLNQKIDNRFENHVCRLDNINNTKLHKHCFVNGLRCVIPCTAYYEWQSTKASTKQPYCFFNKENDSLTLAKTRGSFNEKTGWDGVKLLYLAGFYNVHVDQANEKHYSFSIITTETNDEWSFVHHRMPAVLQTESDVRNWLDVLKFNKDDALSILKKSISNVNAHPVNKDILNKTKQNKGTNCMEKYQPAKTSASLSNWLSKRNFPTATTSSSSSSENATPLKPKPTFMDQWVGKSTKKRPADHNDQHQHKKPKTD